MDLPSFSSSSVSFSQWSTISAHPLVSVLFLCFTFYMIHLILLPSTKNNKSSLREPPKVPGAWPLLGHIDLLSLPFDKFGAMANTYGPVYSIRLGAQEAIVINDWKMVKECFTTHDKLFSNRPVSFAVNHGFNHDYSFNHQPYGPRWRDFRKITILSLLSNQRVEMQQHLRTSELNAWFNRLYISSKTAKNGAVSVEMLSWFKDVAFYVIMRMIIGINGDQQQQNGVFSNEVAKKYKIALDEALHIMETTFAVSDLIPFLEWYDKLRGKASVIAKKVKELDDFQEMWLQEYRQQLKSSNVTTDEHEEDGQVFKPYMESLLSSIQKPQFIGLEADTFIKTSCQDIIFGGYSTITLVLPWALFFLMNNRHVMKKARKELDENIGMDRQAEESDLKQLPYLQAILKETLRLYLPGVDLSRYAGEDCEVGGFHVKAGTKLIVNYWNIYRDPNVWPDPLEFKPERFLSGNSNENVDVKGVSYELIPFGVGRRVCPAVTLATRLLQLALARLIHGFEVNIPREDGTADMSATASIPLVDEKIANLQVLISPRLASELYSLSD